MRDKLRGHTDVQSLNLTACHLYCGSHVGGQKKVHQPNFPLKKQKIIQLLWPRNLILMVSVTSNLIQRHDIWSYSPYQILEEFGYELLDHILNEVI